MTKTVFSPVRWLRRLLPPLLLAFSAGSANAAAYAGVWDPAYGAPFANLGWRGTAEFFVPDTCVPAGSAIVFNHLSCDGDARVTAAEVEFYDITASGQPTLATLTFDEDSFLVGVLRYTSGNLTGLLTDFSNLVNPTENLSALGVSNSTEFSLIFTLTTGPRLAWRDCSSYYSTHHSSSTHCRSGINDAASFPTELVITRIPEPGTLALACLALLGLAPRRVRAALSRRAR